MQMFEQVCNIQKFEFKMLWLSFSSGWLRKPGRRGCGEQEAHAEQLKDEQNHLCSDVHPPIVGDR